MTTYVVARPFEGKEVGDRVEIPDPRRADILRRRRYVTPLNEGGGSEDVEKLTVENKTLNEDVERLTAENKTLNEESKTSVVKAVSLIAVTKLDEFLAVVNDTTALTAALEAETRETAVPLIEARLEELTD